MTGIFLLFKFANLTMKLNNFNLETTENEKISMQK